MNGSILIFLLITSVSLLSTLGSSAQDEKNVARPNILLILSDDRSVPYLGVYGNPDLKTPHLDSLAQSDVRFNRAYTTAPQCVPSQASILTGRNVVDIRINRFTAPLAREIPTTPEFLDSVDYYTGICVRSYHLDGSSRKADKTVETYQKYDMVTFTERVDYLKKGSDPEVLGQFQEILGQVPSEMPFFRWMNFSDPHRKFTADAYEPDPMKITVPNGMPDTKEVRKYLAQHYGEIMRLDAHIGEVFNELEQRGIANKAIIIFTGDDGAALLRGKETLYDLGLHVPLIVAGPGVASGASRPSEK